ncbi:hypothetical protein D5085_01420 [Ectothiorhodospiraceae bacterium BW-2]|nr:hypothetical protein D5085_01420 [Ectothiorhodospiraceae bacterium BW-2]
MEFFRRLDTPLPPSGLQAALTIAALPTLCASIGQVLQNSGEEGEIYSLWGQFKVRREEINGGVRFTLPTCPNALAWTVTTAPAQLTIHTTINRTEHDPDFIESIELFMDDWVEGLSQLR